MRTVYLHGFSGDDHGLLEFAEAMPYRPYSLWLLPGFGGKPVTPKARDNFLDYIQVVGEELLSIDDSAEGISLIGHSQGAFVAYALAARYPSLVKELTLINPVAKPRFMARFAARVAVFSARFLPEKGFLALVQQPRIVDALSLYMTRRIHNTEARQRIYSNRRRESVYYTKDMTRIGLMATRFSRDMDNSHVDATTTICYAGDDFIAGSGDIDWYLSRCRNVEKVTVTDGGHLSVIAFPQDIARKIQEKSA